MKEGDGRWQQKMKVSDLRSWMGIFEQNHNSTTLAQCQRDQTLERCRWRDRPAKKEGRIQELREENFMAKDIYSER